LKIKNDYSDTYNNLGLTYLKIKNYEKSISSFDNAIKFDKKFLDAFVNRGTVYLILGKYKEAYLDFEKALFLKPDCKEAIIKMGDILFKNKKIPEALIHYKNAYNISQDSVGLLGKIIHSKMSICDWSDYDELKNQIKIKILSRKDVIRPHINLYINDDHKIQKKLLNTNLKILNEKNFFNNKTKIFFKKNKKIKLGYFSTDFKTHAVSYLIKDLFKFHNKDEFEIYAFYIDDFIDETNEELVKYFDQFFFVKNYTTSEIVKKCKDLNLDIIIDLNGHSDNHRVEIFAFKPAPIIINFLGYPGTSGLWYYDYLVADKNLIPNKFIDYYSEKLIFMPDCHQINSDIKIEGQFSKKDFEIPENSFVFACFNNPNKFTPNIFKIWMDILKEIKNSVIWFISENNIIKKNLQTQAKANNIGIERLIFSNSLPKLKHLNRYLYTDLFLDNFPYNAHVTASDCLRLGTPLITLCGDMYQSRVAASLLKALQMDELITYTEMEYKNLIIEIASNKEKYASIKYKLKKNLLESNLFNSEIYTKNFEKNLKLIYEKFKSNRTIDHINI
jgi:predicted O-linked N-acetylglucosamine transferase (SPINDLY family)